MANTGSKVFGIILNNRLTVACEQSGVLGAEQNGFRKDTRGEDNIFIIREIMERSKKGKNPYIHSIPGYRTSV